MLIRCGILGQADWAATLDGSGVEVIALSDDLHSFQPERHQQLNVLVVTAAAMAAAGAAPGQVHASLRRLLPDCAHVCVRDADDPPVDGWPETDLYTWPADAFRLFRRISVPLSQSSPWWDAPRSHCTGTAATVPAERHAHALDGPAPPAAAAPPAGAVAAREAASSSVPVYVPRWSAPRPPVAPHGQLATGQVISVIGAKGGVGQTWVAVNLAVALASQLGMECLLADLDLASADVAVFLGLLGAPTLVDLMQQRDEDGWPWSGLHQLRSCPLRILTGPERPQMASLLTPEEVTETVRTLQERFAYTVCDHAPGETDPLYLAVSEHAAATVLVTTLDAPALRQAKLRLDHLRQRGLLDRTHVVLNKSGPGGVQAADGAAYLEHTVCTVIPLDRRGAEQALHEARPVAMQARSEVGRAFYALAAAITGIGGAAEAAEQPWRRWLEQLWRR